MVFSPKKDNLKVRQTFGLPLFLLLESYPVNYWEKFKANVNPVTVVSTMVGLGLFGVLTVLAVKSQIKPLVSAVKTLNGKTSK